jgi:phage repressor protein C with HTH and peptisase S24 domain
MENIRERIKKVLANHGTTANAISGGISAVQNKLSRQLREAAITADTIQLILDKFPDVSAEWLLRGENVKAIELNREGDSVKTLPRIPYDAAAGSLTDAVDGVTEYQCERLPVVSAFPKYDFTMRVSGRSMEPYYFSGDEVACLRINEARFIQWGRVHVLDTTQGVVIKRIYDNGDCIRCASYNPEYPDFNVPKADIRSYNLVVGALRL